MGKSLLRGVDDPEAWFPRGPGPHPPAEPSLAALGSQRVKALALLGSSS